MYTIRFGIGSFEKIISQDSTTPFYKLKASTPNSKAYIDLFKSIANPFKIVLCNYLDSVEYN